MKKGVVIIEGHVQGLSNTRALGEIGVPVIIVDKTNCVARYSKYCKSFYYCPDFISLNFINFLIEIGKRENLYGWMLLPSNDHAVINISRNREKLQSVYKILTPERSVISRIYDKSLLIEAAIRSNVPVPLTYFNYNRSDIDIRTFPVIIKGRNGLSFYKATGRKVFLANSEDELRSHYFELQKVIDTEDIFVQELIPHGNKTISFTAFCEQGVIKTFWIGEKVREHPVRFGTATFARSILCTDLIDPAKRIISELNYTGVCEIEFLKDPRDNIFKLIEINARTWLWVDLAKSCGVNYAKLIYDYVNSQKVDYPAVYNTGVNWVNYLTDSVFSITALLKKQLRVKDYLSSFKGKNVNASFSWKDPIPGFMFLILSFYIFIKRK
jgi:predicted ATP-grasp superfamily ATP-dependent carboligase